MKKKKQAFKIWLRTKTEADEQAYREMNKETKKVVAMAKTRCTRTYSRSWSQEGVPKSSIS